MTYETAHKILSAHQAFWALGDLDGLEYTAAEVNEALELAITALQSDPETPDWSQAPEWATHCHKDSSGHEWWYECEPEKTSITYNPKIGRIKLAKAAHPMAKVKNHIEKLFKRPDQ